MTATSLIFFWLTTSCVVHQGDVRTVAPPPEKPPPWGTTPMTAATSKPVPKGGKDAVLRVVPFRLTFGENLTEDRYVELLPDGTIMMSGKKTGQIADNKVTLNVRPTEITLLKDGRVAFKEHPDLFIQLDDPPISFTSPQGGRLAVNDKLQIVSMEKGATSSMLFGTWQGYAEGAPEARTLMLLIMAEINRPIDLERRNRETMQQLNDAMDHPPQ